MRFGRKYKDPKGVVTYLIVGIDIYRVLLFFLMNKK